jgi:hypothetical protein
MDNTKVEQNLTATETTTAETASVLPDNSTTPQNPKPGMGSRFLNALGLGENFLGSAPKPQEPPTQLPTTEMQPLQSTPETSAANVISQPTVDLEPIQQPTSEGPTPILEQSTLIETPTPDFQPKQPTPEIQPSPTEPTEPFGSRLDSGKPFDEYFSPQSTPTDKISSVNPESQNLNPTPETVTSETVEPPTQTALEPAPEVVPEPPTIPDTGTISAETTPVSELNPIIDKPIPVIEQVSLSEASDVTTEIVTPEPNTDATTVAPASSTVEPVSATSQIPTETAPISSLGPMPMIGGEGSTSTASSEANPEVFPTTELPTTPPSPDTPQVVKYG